MNEAIKQRTWFIFLISHVQAYHTSFEPRTFLLDQVPLHMCSMVGLSHRQLCYPSSCPYRDGEGSPIVVLGWSGGWWNYIPLRSDWSQGRL